MRLEIFTKPGFGRRIRRFLTGEPQPMTTRKPVNSAEYVPPAADPVAEQPEPEQPEAPIEETQS